MAETDIIALLEHQLDQKYREAKQAIGSFRGFVSLFENIKGFAAQITSASAPEITRSQSVVPAKRGGKVTRVQRVLDAISAHPKTVEELHNELSIPESAIRGVLYSKFTQDRILSRKDGKRRVFFAKHPQSQDASVLLVTNPLAVSVDNGEPLSIAALVRQAIAASHGGLKFRDIHNLLDSAIISRGGKVKAIDGALAGMKSRGILKHDRHTGNYTLANGN
jgi:hypothetical protein